MVGTVPTWGRELLNWGVKSLIILLSFNKKKYYKQKQRGKHHWQKIEIKQSKLIAEAGQGYQTRRAVEDYESAKLEEANREGGGE